MVGSSVFLLFFCSNTTHHKRQQNVRVYKGQQSFKLDAPPPRRMVRESQRLSKSLSSFQSALLPLKPGEDPKKVTSHQVSGHE